MKRFLSILSMMCIGLTLWADNNEPQESRKEIYIVRSKQHTEIMRDISINVRVFADYTSRILELESYGIGDFDVYIVDSKNQIVDQMTLCDDISTCLIPMPEVSGNYVLVIWSDKYYGEGVFTIV